MLIIMTIIMMITMMSMIVISFPFIAGTMMNIEQRMMEQKQRKAAEQKKRSQGRQAFKAQLESNAPATRYSMLHPE